MKTRLCFVLSVFAEGEARKAFKVSAVITDPLFVCGWPWLTAKIFRYRTDEILIEYADRIVHVVR